MGVRSVPEMTLALILTLWQAPAPPATFTVVSNQQGIQLPGVVSCQSLVDAQNALALALLVDPVAQTCVPVRVVQFGVPTANLRSDSPAVTFAHASFIRLPTPHDGKELSWVVPLRNDTQPYFVNGYPDITALDEGVTALVAVK